MKCGPVRCGREFSSCLTAGRLRLRKGESLARVAPCWPSRACAAPVPLTSGHLLVGGRAPSESVCHSLADCSPALLSLQRGRKVTLTVMAFSWVEARCDLVLPRQLGGSERAATVTPPIKAALTLPLF